MTCSESVRWNKKTSIKAGDRAVYIRRYDKTGRFCITERLAADGYATTYVASTEIDGRYAIIGRSRTYKGAKKAVARYIASLFDSAAWQYVPAVKTFAAGA